jgi:guanylate kinase
MKKTNQPKAIVVVVAGPTGSGETSVSRAITKILPNIKITLTTTSRPPRLGEKNHVDYNFISKAEFKKGIRTGRFLEYIKILNRDNYYGTSREDIEKYLKKGISVIANLEIRGARVMKKTFPDTLTIFIKPDKLSRIKKRLLERDPTISHEEYKKRLKNAKTELKEAKFYDYVIINHEGQMLATAKRIAKLIKTRLTELDRS